MPDALIAQAALAAAVAWGAGLRLYAVVLILGLVGRYGGFDLPASLHVLAHLLVIGVSGLLSLAEFIGDKSGTRALINTSPEPVSNAAASLGDEALLGGGLWLAFAHPLAFLAALAVFMAVTLWVLRRLWRWRRQPGAPAAQG